MKANRNGVNIVKRSVCMTQRQFTEGKQLKEISLKLGMKLGLRDRLSSGLTAQTQVESARN